METDITPEQLLADAESDLRSVRAEMLQLALPMHKQMYPDHGDHSDVTGRDRENLIIGEVLAKISDDHWFVLKSAITEQSGTVDFRFWSWALPTQWVNDYRAAVGAGRLQKTQFINEYFGYLIAKR